MMVPTRAVRAVLYEFITMTWRGDNRSAFLKRDLCLALGLLLTVVELELVPTHSTLALRS